MNDKPWLYVYRVWYRRGGGGGIGLSKDYRIRRAERDDEGAHASMRRHWLSSRFLYLMHRGVMILNPEKERKRERERNRRRR